MNEQIEQIKKQVPNLGHRPPLPHYSKQSTPNDSKDSGEFIKNSP